MSAQPGVAFPPGRRLSQLARHGVGELEGVGPRKVAALRALGIENVLDLLMNYPRRYADRTNAVRLADAVAGEEAVVSGTVRSVDSRRLRGGRAMVTASVDDGTGVVRVSFFNQPWRAQQLRRGSEVVLFGKLDWFRERLSMANPIVDVIAGPGATERERRTGRVVPIYRQSERAGVSSAEIGDYVLEALRRAGPFADPLPEELRQRLQLIGRTEAMSWIHAPERLEDRWPARRRLAFDELFRLQLELVLRKRAVEAASRGISHRVGSAAGSATGTRGATGTRSARGATAERPAAATPADLVASFVAALPFELTAAQRGAIAEIAGDLARPVPMHRLLQGDVGSGKTVVALAALLVAVQGGYQGALMVPTEVLAEQHFLAASRMLAGLEVSDESRLGGLRPLNVALLTSRTGAADRTRLRHELASGAVDVLVGTHALITDDVVFAALGVVVIDEQHRFGVDQRAALREKGGGSDPDVLVMTATPIPRTAAMTVYGDLDSTVLDELPAGRRPVTTRWLEVEDAEELAWKAVREAVASGRQAYVVCPLVRPAADGESEDDGAAAEDLGGERAGDSTPEARSDEVVASGGEDTGRAEANGAPRGPAPWSAGRLIEVGEDGEDGERRPPRSAVEEHARLGAGPLAGLRLGLLHGQLPAKEKDSVMSAFRAGDLDVLVATTVIEVGVDVPLATVMVIEDADRFGIAQLHQLRGRVGRGSDPSSCFLLASGVGEPGERRLRALEASNDGFELAEVDLDLRGEGTVLGARQKGRNDLRLASLRTDRDLVIAARREAEAIVAADPGLELNPLLNEELGLFIGEDEGSYLSKS